MSADTGMDLFSMLPLIVWIGLCVGLAFIPANIARKKGYSYGGFWALGFFFFLIGLIVALCLPDKTVPPPYQQYQQPYQVPNPQQNTQQFGVCPNCGAGVMDGAVFCSKCGAKNK